MDSVNGSSFTATKIDFSQIPVYDTEPRSTTLVSRGSCCLDGFGGCTCQYDASGQICCQCKYCARYGPPTKHKKRASDNIETRSFEDIGSNTLESRQVCCIYGDGGCSCRIDAQGYSCCECNECQGYGPPVKFTRKGLETILRRARS